MAHSIKICPFCSEEIKATAIKCRYCSSMLTDVLHLSDSLSGPNPNAPLTGIELVRHALEERYEVIDEIGSGGMATVYKAIQRSLGRKVALKVIHQNLLHDQDFVKRFHREAQISASLQHPNIVTIYDVGEAHGVHYMAMEYLEGTDLQSMITKKGRLGENQSLGYLLSVARALDYVHNRGLIHRDIKSSNIFICNDPDYKHAGSNIDTDYRKSARVVLMDFGIAQAASGTRLTRAGAVIGSPDYMSPEQAEAKKVDHRTDIYSMGVVLFECLTGQVPFTTDSYIKTIRKVIDEQPDTSKLNHVHASLKHFTLMLMSKQANARPANALKIVNNILNFQSGNYKELESWSRDINWSEKIPENDLNPDGYRETLIGDINHMNYDDIYNSNENEPYFDESFIGRMILVRGGTFIIENVQEQKNNSYYIEKNPHQVKISDFYIGKYPVTQKQWRQVMGNNPSHFSGCDDCPADSVSWNDVQEFIRKLNQQTGKRYRLPAEVEWEFAARGGGRSMGYKYAGSDCIDEVAWYDGNSQGKTQPVGLKRANELDLYDMSGNVWEWCQDKDMSYTQGSKSINRGALSTNNHVLRGVSWNHISRNCILSVRLSQPPIIRYFCYGFRLALSP